MPYVASNRDVREQEGFKTALMGTALAVGAIAMGGDALKKRGFGGYNGSKVAKDLYGKYGNELTSDVVDNIRIRNSKDIAESGMTAYGVVGGKKGPRVKATNGNPIQNFKNNHLNPEVKAFNKKLADYANGSDGVYSTSKLSLYDSLFSDSEKSGIGLTTKQMTGLTNDIYETSANKAIRGSGYTIKDDAQISNSIWGKGPSAKEVRGNFEGMHPNNKNTADKYKSSFKEGYNAAHNSDFDEDSRVQRGKSHMWKEDIKAQMRKEGVDERVAKGKAMYQADRKAKATNGASPEINIPDGNSVANGFSGPSHEEIVASRTPHVPMDKSSMFHEGFNRGNLVNDKTVNLGDMKNKLNRVDYIPKVQSARKNGSSSMRERM